MTNLVYILAGLATGILSGFLGLGGGLVLIPFLIFVAGLTQHEAQGTTLAIMIPPIGLLAAWRYFTAGQVRVSIAALICVGFFFGGFVGAHYAQYVSDTALRRCFGVLLFIAAIKCFLTK